MIQRAAAKAWGVESYLMILISYCSYKKYIIQRTFSTGQQLLQLRPTSASPRTFSNVCSRRRTQQSSQADHTNRTAWAHYACLTTTSLAACLTPSRIHAGRSRVQGSTRSRVDVSLRRLSVGGGSRSTSAIGWYTDMCRTADQDPVWCQVFTVAAPRVCN